MVEHLYGGPWTQIKIEAVVYYLQCYTAALKRVPFELWYIDAFAGTGDRTVEKLTGGWLEAKPLSVETETLDGSARRALKVEPPFDHCRFIERNRERFDALNTLRGEYPGRDIDCLRGDANTELRTLCGPKTALAQAQGSHRGAVFLDPYALQVHWETLSLLANTQVLDVWYLFPLGNVTRQLARKFSGVGNKEKMLDRVLSKAWRDLYKMPDPTPDLLGQVDRQLQRTATKKHIERWFKGRLEEQFAFVSDPLPILTSPGRQEFSLFLGVANPSKPAIDLAKKFVRYVIRKYGSASRQKFAP